ARYNPSMYIKFTKSGGHQYVQLAESYRNEQGKPRQRVVANLGRLDDAGSNASAILATLLKATGQIGEPSNNPAQRAPVFESSRALGDVWVLTQIWKQLGLDSLRKALRQRTRHKIDLEALLRV